MSYKPPVSDASTTKKGIVQLAGDLGGTAASPTVPGLAAKLNTSQVGVANGVASLDTNGKVPSAQLALVFPVTTVAGRTGDVALAKSDVGLANVDNTSDAAKPISTATQTALDAKAATSHVHVSTDITDFMEATQDLIGTSVVAGTNVTISYNDTAGTTTINATPGAGVTDLSTTTTANDVTVVSSTGIDAVVAAASTSNAGVMTAADKTKLNGIATGATANSTDATLLNRANHTGTQAISTVSNLQTSLDAKADQATTYTKSEVDTSLSGKANTSHTHIATQISDSTVTGRSLLTAADAPTARTAIGAGTSNLALGTTNTTAKAGDYVPTWTEVTSKPTTFAPSAHSHPISDVTNLQTTLDGKAALSHTHTASNISDSSAVGRAVLTATDTAAAQSALAITNTVQVVDSFASVTTPTYGTLYVVRA